LLCESATVSLAAANTVEHWKGKSAGSIKFCFSPTGIGSAQTLKVGAVKLPGKALHVREATHEEVRGETPAFSAVETRS
jgi:hypothetical protein